MISQINRSYFVGIDTKFGLGKVTYFTYFSEFNRPWQGLAYVEAATMITLCVVSVIGNSFILGFVYKSKPPRTITNYFACNLAIGDILFVVSAPVIAYVRITGTWQLGHGICHVLSYGMFVCASATIWTMAAISIDRYVCINMGAAKRLRPVHVPLICLCIWLISACCFLPVALFFHVKEISAEDRVSFCTLTWPPGNIRYANIFVALLCIVEFGMPLTIIIVNYYRIFRKLWVSKRAVGTLRVDLPRGKQTSQSRKRRDVRIVKTLVLLVVFFILMWLPLFLLFGLIYRDVVYVQNKIPSYGLTWALIIAYCNSCVNPCLYCCINFELRRTIRFCCGHQNIAELLVSNTRQK